MTLRNKQDQARTVSAGFAFGLLMNGYNVIPNDKIIVESAFAKAWRNWKYRDLFPAITSSKPRVDLYWMLLDLDKDKKKPMVPFHWEPYAATGPTVIVREASGFDLTDEGDLEFYAGMISEEVSYDAWRILAAGFIAQFQTESTTN